MARRLNKAGRATGVQIPGALNAEVEMREKKAKGEPVATALNESTLRERALLVRFTIGRWYGSGADEAVVHEIRSSKEATGEIGSFTKRMMKRERLAAINSVTTVARKYHKMMTLPWGDTGARLLSSDAFVEYKKRMTQYEQEFNVAVEEFLAGYEKFAEEEKKNLGKLWKQTDYPSVDEMRMNFRYLVSVDILPDSSDIRVKLSKEQAEEIQHDVEQRMQESLRGAVGDIYARIREQIEDAQQKVDGGHPRANLFKGLQDLLVLLPQLNVTRDPNLTKLATEIQRDLLSVAPDDLKASATTRSATSKKAGALLAGIALLQKGA